MDNRNKYSVFPFQSMCIIAVGGVYHQWHSAFGDQTLTPILEQVNYSLPKCYEDKTLILPKEQCPEFEQPRWYTGLTGPARNDIKILLRDPRDGPHLPFALNGMALWNVNGSGPLNGTGDPGFPDPWKPGGPMYGEKCASMKECWDVFLQRFNGTSTRLGEAPLLNFVKLFDAGSNLKGKSRKDILSMKDTFFYNWLKLAGLDVDSGSVHRVADSGVAHELQRAATLLAAGRQELS